MPKKTRQLHELNEIYKDAFDKQSQTCKPKKASDMHWIAHELMIICLDKWGIYSTPRKFS